MILKDRSVQKHWNLLEKNNLQVVKKISFPDHYNYSRSELEDLVEFSIKNKLKVVTTAKDYCRIMHHNISQIQSFDVKLEIKNRSKFEEEIIKCLL